MNVVESGVLKASRRLISMALQRLSEMLNDGLIGMQLVPKIKIELPGTIKMRSEYRPDWSFASLRVLSELEQSVAYVQFEQKISRDSLLSSRMNTLVGTSITRRRMTCRDFLQVLLTRALKCSDDDLQLSDELFHEMWESVVKSLLANRIFIKYWCILENVETPLGSTEVLPRVFLRGLNTCEIEDLWDHNSFVQSYYPFDGFFGSSILNVQTLLETTIDEEVVVGEGDYDSSEAMSRFEFVRSSFESTCTSIRLLRSEQIAMSQIFAETSDIWGSSTASGSMERRSTQYFGRCKLSEQDMNELLKLLKVVSLGKSGLSRAVMVCLRRIGFANMRYSLEDRLLDISIALEALVLSDAGKPSERTELSFRLAIRLAKFLGANKKEQLSIYETVRRGYGLRSKVIHGGELDQKEQALVSELEKLTKSATRKYLFALAECEKVDWHAILFD